MDKKAIKAIKTDDRLYENDLVNVNNADDISVIY